MELIAQTVYLIDLGPEGGQGGGRLVACGTPEEIMAESASYTGWYLRRYQERRQKGFLVSSDH